MFDSVLYGRFPFFSLIKENNKHVWFAWQVIEMSQLTTCPASEERGGGQSRWLFTLFQLHCLCS